MARENLLDEGRAGTRHADHEDRLGRAMTATAHALHELGREGRSQCGEEARSRQLVINDVRALQRVAGREMAERFLMAVEVRASLIERETQVDLLRHRQCGDVARQHLHRLKLRIVGDEAVQAREAVIMLRLAGLESDSRLEREPGLVELACLLERDAEIMVRRREARIERDGAPIGCERLLVTAEPAAGTRRDRYGRPRAPGPS